MNDTEVIDSLKLNIEVKKMVKGYLNISFNDLKCRTPYWRDRIFADKSKNVKGFLGGKGEPIEIESEVWARINQLSDELKPRNDLELFAWMKKNKIGVDCSGLAFALLKIIANAKNDDKWEQRITATPGGNLDNAKRFRTSANTLTSGVNARELLPGEEFQLGDLVRLMAGKHVMIILGEIEKKIYYIHSSNETVIEGAHLGYFYQVGEDKIKFSNEDLLKKGNTWSDEICKENEDGIYRINEW